MAYTQSTSLRPRDPRLPSFSPWIRLLMLTSALVASVIVPGCGASAGSDEGDDDDALGEAEEAITAGTNLAVGKPATSSSVLWGGDPSRAVDGNTNGDWNGLSVAQTAIEMNPWIQVDLQSSQFIGTVALWGRTDCCAETLSNFRLRMSDDGATWQDISYSGTVAKQTTIAVNRSARYVRVQLDGTSTRYMNLAEMQVFGPPNLAQGKPASQSTTGWGAEASRAVDGNTDGNFGNGSVTHTVYDPQAWWQVDLLGLQNVGIVELYNRTDCCSDRLTNFKLLVSENGTDWTSFNYPGQPPAKLAFAVNRAARFVKVQLNGTNYLSLAEVRVYPTANAAVTGTGAGSLPLGNYPTSPIGMVDGDFSVDAQGASTYSVPIKVPPGLRGVEPKLALSYRSGGNNGLVGAGWSLSGMPMVTRCPRTKAQDGIRGGVNGDADDRFCLDGQRLVAIAGAYGANGTQYRTEIDSYSRVYSYGTCGTGPCRFEVTDKTGNTAVLGETNVVATLSDGSTPRAFALKQLEDPNGNYLTASYTLDAGQLYPQQVLYTMHDAAPSLKKRRVGFEYEARTDKDFAYVAGTKITTNQRLSRVKTYVTTAQGEELVREYRLVYSTSDLSKRSLLASVAECDAKGICLPATEFDYNSAGAPAASKFSFVTPTGTGLYDYQDIMRYDPGAFLYPADVTGDGRTDLLRVQHGPGTPSACNLSEYFSKGDGTFTAFEPPGPDFVIMDGDQVDVYPFDYNGDGKMDFIRREKNDWDHDAYNTFAVYVADNPTGFQVYKPGTQGAWGDYYQGLLGADGGTSIITGDFNGDGRGDFLRQQFGTWADNEPGIMFNVFFSTGTNGDFDVVTPTGVGYGWVLRGDYVEIIPGDFNGDGKTDFIRRELADWALDYHMTFGVYYSKGDGTFDIYYPGQGVAGDIFQDDLRSGIYVFTGDPIPEQAGAAIIPGDFNGDGKTDFIRQQWGGFVKTNPANNFNVYFSTGKNGNFERVTPTGWDYGDTMRGDNVDIYTLDYNGDGKTDFLRREKGAWDGDTAYTLAIYTSKGDGTFDVFYPYSGTVPEWYQDGCRRRVANILTGDFDGDGKGDFLRQEWDGYDNDTANTFNVFFANGDDAGDYLKKVTNGLGATVDVTYAPLNDSSVYTKGTSGAYPNIDFQGSMYVVKSTISGQVGTSASETNTYKYESALMNAEGRGFLGFAKVLQSSSAGTTQATYNQAFPFTGTIKSRQQQSGSNQVVVDRSYSIVQNYPGVYAVLPSTEETTHYEGPTSTPPSFKSGKAFLYDAYGNPAIVRDYGVYGDTSDDVDTCTVWNNDVAPWLIAYPRFSYVADSCTFASGSCSCTGYKQKVERYGSGPNVTEVYEYEDWNWIWLRTAYTYDVHGNVVTKTVPGYVPSGSSTAAQIVESTTYDPDYMTFPVTQSRYSTSLGLTTTFAYDPRFGTLAAQTDANGNTVATQFDGLGRVAASSATSPTGYVTPVVRVAYGSDTNGNYRMTSARNGWDVDDWRWEREYIDGKGRIVRTESQSTDSTKPVVTKREYDAFGEVKKESMPFYLGDAEVYTTYSRDWLGRISQIVAPNGSVTNVSYGVSLSTCPLCVQAETTTEAVNTANQRTSIRYTDVDGHVLRQVDAEGRVTTFTYDKLGRQVSSTNAAGTTTTQYDSLGRVLSSTSPDRNTITNVYDWRNGWLTRTTDGNGQQIDYTYDALGRVVQKAVVGKQTVTFAYDNFAYSNSVGRLTNVSVVPAGQTTPSSTNAFSYTPDGRIATHVIGIDNTTFAVTSTYDPQGRLTSFTYPDGTVLSRPYNAQGLLSQLSIGGTVYAQYSNYSAAGQPGLVQYGSGTASERTYDTSTRITSAKTTGPNNTKLLDYTYNWDWLHRITGLVDNRDGTRTQSFTYSPSGQLTQAIGIFGLLSYSYDNAGNMTSKEGSSYTYANHRVVSGTNFTATYDGAGNRTAQTRNGISWTYQFDGENRIQSVTKNGALVNQFAYDFTGERVKKIDANDTKTLYITQNFEVTLLPDGRRLETKYVNDASGRVAAITTEFAAQGAALLEMRGLDSTKELFDKRSIRGLAEYAKTRVLVLCAEPSAKPMAIGVLLLVLAFAASSQWRRRSPLAFARAIEKLRAVLLPPQTAYARRHPLHALAIPLVLASFLAACNRAPGEALGYTDDALTAGANGEGNPIEGTYYFHNNHLASASVVTNANGVEVARAEYKPYGEIVQSASPGLDIFRSKFTGKEWDKDSELYYFNARYYDPVSGRFMSADSLLSGGPADQTTSLNPYAYAGNNPVVYSDPSGHFLFLVVLIAVVVGAYAGGMSTNGTWNCAAWNWNSWQTYMGIAAGGVAGGFSAGLGAGVGGFAGAMLTTALDSVVLNGLRFISPQGNTLENFALGMSLDLAAGGVMAKAMPVMKSGASTLWSKTKSAWNQVFKNTAKQTSQEVVEAAANAVKPKLSKQVMEAAGDLGKGAWKTSKKIATNEARQRYWNTGFTNGDTPRVSSSPTTERVDGSGVSDFLRDVSDSVLSAAGAGDMAGRLSSDWASSRRGTGRATKRAPEAFAGFAVAH